METGMRALRGYLALALFCLTLAIYLVTLTQVHTFDALSYVLSVERKPWTEVFHPHHLAYGPVGALTQAIGRMLGYAGGAALPMQLVNAVAGALGVGLLSRVTLRVTQRTDLALVMALLLGSSYAYWYYAVEIEVYTVAALLLIVCLAILTNPHPPSARTMLLLGIAQGGAILFHQTNVLLCAPVAVWWLMAVRHSHNRLRALLLGGVVYCATLLVMIVVPYLWVGFGVSKFASLEAFAAWMTQYARTGWWGGPLTWDKGTKLAKGLSETLTVGWGGYAGLGLLGLGLAGWLRPIIRGGADDKNGERHDRQIDPEAGVGRLNVASQDAMPSHRHGGEERGQRESGGLGLTLVAWLLVYGGFFLWWEPDNIEFWIASLPAALLLLALSMRGWRPWGLATWLGLALALGLGVSNFDAIRRRGDAATDLQRDITRALAVHSTPADLLIVPDGLQELYLPYYQQRENFISLNQAIFDTNASWDAACALIRSRIETARYAGATVLIAEEALSPPADLLTRHRLTQSQVASCFAPYLAEFRAVSLPPSIPAYLQLPPAQEYADGAGWQFEHSALGWRSTNVSAERFDAGWHMRPASDPSLTSPLLQIDTRTIDAIEVLLASTTQARDAQIFLIGDDGRTDEARSLRWELLPGAELQSYRIDLRGKPGWQGIISRIRIDPVGVGDGGELRVVSVRLVR